MPINNVILDDEDTNPDVIVDTGEPASVYPVADDERLGVSTDKGTNPEVLDDPDEQNMIKNTPDDVGDGNIEGDEKGIDDAIVIK